jgi:hypothetical protein
MDVRLLVGLCHNAVRSFIRQHGLLEDANGILSTGAWLPHLTALAILHSLYMKQMDVSFFPGTHDPSPFILSSSKHDALPSRAAPNILKEKKENIAAYGV